MEQDILTAIELLKQGKIGKVSKHIFTVQNAVVYRDIKGDKDTSLDRLKKIEEIIAIKTDSGVILGNSSRMNTLEDKRLKTRIEPARIQRLLSEHITMIPFSVFLDAGLDILTCEIVDEGPAETLLERTDTGYRIENYKTIERHFTGARLFRALTKNRGNGVPYERKYFLCDVDRREIQYNIVNFFLAELPEKCESIEDAYLMLKPNEVKMFEDNTGKEVLRQGEFFFLPINPHVATSLVLDSGNVGEMIREIRVGNSRPNRVEKGIQLDGKIYVSGTISHTGREHKDLDLPLDQWFKVVPNTSKANFQLTGDID